MRQISERLKRADVQLNIPRQASNGTPALNAKPIPTRRAGMRLAISVVLVVVGVAGGLIAYGHFGHRVAVLALRANMTQGQRIKAADLEVVRIPTTPGLATVSASAESSVLGRRAAAALGAGQLLVPADLSASIVLPPGQVEIGVALAQSQLPSEGVSPGELVAVIATLPSGGTKTASGATAGTQLTTAKVMASAGPASGGSVAEVVSLQVPATAESSVAADAAAGQLSLVPIPG